MLRLLVAMRNSFGSVETAILDKRHTTISRGSGLQPVPFKGGSLDGTMHVRKKSLYESFGCEI